MNPPLPVKMAVAPQFEPPRFIAVEGPFGVGNTELAKILAEQLQARLMLDLEENPFLKDFYQGLPGGAFQAQFYFLIERFHRMQQLDQFLNPRHTVVSDFVFEKDRLYANLNLGDEELQLYNQYYDQFAVQVPTADLVIYLQSKAKVLKSRITRRKGHWRLFEKYLEEVVEAYDHFFFHYKASSLLVIETSEIDFLDRKDDLQELLRRLRQPVRGTQYFLPLGSVPTD